MARKLKKAGMNSSDTAQLHFDNVRVPQRWRIGEEGMGFTYQMQQFQEERLWAAAGWRKNHEIIQETIAYLRERQAFGKPLLDNQYIYFKLAELATEVEAMGALFHKAVALYVAGNDVTQLASMCKLKCARLAREVADWCVQFWGGMGYIEETRVNRAWRDIASGLDRRRRRRGDDGHHRQDDGHLPSAKLMFDKLLIAHCGDNGRAAVVAAKPNCLARAARAGDLRARTHV